MHEIWLLKNISYNVRIEKECDRWLARVGDSKHLVCNTALTEKSCPNQIKYSYITMNTSYLRSLRFYSSHKFLLLYQKVYYFPLEHTSDTCKGPALKWDILILVGSHMVLLWFLIVKYTYRRERPVWRRIVHFQWKTDQARHTAKQ